MDFTFKTYNKLIESLLKKGFSFYRIVDYDPDNTEKSVFLRHDVDKHPENSRKFAILQKTYNIKGTYYFRVHPNSWNEKIIEEIASLGHEIGYHYEDLDVAWSAVGKRRSVNTTNINAIEVEIANLGIESFIKNLEKLRKIAPVKTICMHGSPLSRWDNRLLWKFYDYKSLGIRLEPYFDINFSNMLYLTDTGRRWNGESVTIRDKGQDYAFSFNERFENWKVKPIVGSLLNMSFKSIEHKAKYRFHSTYDILEAIITDNFPDKILMTFHPQRWTQNSFQWTRELFMQNTKNLVKFAYLLSYGSFQSRVK